MERENQPLDQYRERVAVAFARWRARQPAGANRQEDFARAVVAQGGRDVSQNAVSRWLSGAIPRDLPTMRALALAMEIDPGWLFFADVSAAPAPAIGGSTSPPPQERRPAQPRMLPETRVEMPKPHGKRKGA